MAGRRRNVDEPNYDSIFAQGYTDNDTPPALPPPRTQQRKGKSSSKTESATTKVSQRALPALPPQTNYESESLRNKEGSSGNFYISDNSTQRKSLTLTEFVKKHSQSLPLRVSVTEGFCGSDARYVISAGDVYNFHFIKKEKVMAIQDAGGTRFAVPLNTEIQFGLVYDPVGDMKGAVKGYSFKTIGELAEYPSRPNIVRATRRWEASDPKSSVESDEILIIKSVGRTSMKKKPCVKVHSFLTRSEKTLLHNCEGGFVTDPGSVRLYLTDIHEFFKDKLPQKAMIFLNSDVTDDSISHLVSEVITLTHVSVESAIIATCTNDGENVSESEFSEEDEGLVSIPINMDITVDIVSDDSDYEDLYDNTMNLFDNFNPSKVRDMSGSTAQPGVTSVRKAVRQGYEFRGLEIERPAFKSFPRNSVANEVPQDDYEVIDSHNENPPNQAKPNYTRKKIEELNPINALAGQGVLAHASPGTSPRPSRKKMAIPPPLPSKDTPDQKQIPKHPVPTLEHREGESKFKSAADEVKKDSQAATVDDLSKKLSQLKSTVTDLSQKLDQLQSEMKQLQEKVNVRKKPSISEGVSDKIECGDVNSNIEKLKSLSYIEVLKVLDNMNMSQYKENFQYEQVDGDTLASCDEEVLLHELKVTNKIHRIKLMKLISGKNDITALLECKNPYVVQ